MDLEDLDYVLESLLLVSGNGISVDEITDTLGLQRSEVNDSIRRLKKKYSGKRGILLLSYSNKSGQRRGKRAYSVQSQVCGVGRKRAQTRARKGTVFRGAGNRCNRRIPSAGDAVGDRAGSRSEQRLCHTGIAET